MKTTSCVFILKGIAAIILALSLQSGIFSQSLKPGDSIKSLVDFLNAGTFLSPKDYILKSLEEKDIVVLSERHHREFTQYKLIVDVIQDKRFSGDVYTEVGVFNSGDRINEFLKKEGLSAEQVETEILDIFKKLDMFPLWPNYNYYYLLESVYQINQQRNQNDKIFIHPLDVPFDWDSISCDEQYKMFVEMMEPQNNMPPVIDRNSIMAKLFIRNYYEAKYYNPNKRKALVIMNTYHGYTRIPPYLPFPNEPTSYSTASYIYKTYPDKTKGILINFYPTSNEIKLVADGKWDAAFKLTGNKNKGFDFADTPFGETKFDMYNFGGNDYKQVNFEYLFDGFIFYEPIENFQLAVGIPHIFDDSLFVLEFYRRTTIDEHITLEEAKSSMEIQSYIKEKNGLKINKLPNLDQYYDLINQWILK